MLPTRFQWCFVLVIWMVYDDVINIFNSWLWPVHFAYTQYFSAIDIFVFHFRVVRPQGYSVHLLVIQDLPRTRDRRVLLSLHVIVLGMVFCNCVSLISASQNPDQVSQHVFAAREYPMLSLLTSFQQPRLGNDIAAALCHDHSWSANAYLVGLILTYLTYLEKPSLSDIGRRRVGVEDYPRPNLSFKEFCGISALFKPPPARTLRPDPYQTIQNSAF